MGRWAQAQRRGGSGPGVPSLGPPPAPALTRDGDNGRIVPANVIDGGGQFRCYFSNDSVNYALVATEDYHPLERIVFDLLLNGTGWYYATEVGNNVAYAGESAPSEIQYWEYS